MPPRKVKASTSTASKTKRTSSSVASSSVKAKARDAAKTAAVKSAKQTEAKAAKQRKEVATTTTVVRSQASSVRVNASMPVAAPSYATNVGNSNVLHGVVATRTRLSEPASATSITANSNAPSAVAAVVAVTAGSTGTAVTSQGTCSCFYNLSSILITYWYKLQHVSPLWTPYQILPPNNQHPNLMRETSPISTAPMRAAESHR